MTEQENVVEKKLQKLGHRLRRGWRKLHPVTQKQMEAVRAVVRKQWEQKQKKESGQTHVTDEQGKTQSQQQSIGKPSKPKSKSRNHGHSH